MSLSQPHSKTQASTSSTAPIPAAEVCPRCGVEDRPALGPGRGPHACESFCAHCGRHLRWVSLHSPAERIERKKKAMREVMAQQPPTALQLEYLKALGDKLAVPSNKAEASERIDALRQQQQRPA
jgi:hypothetical protein